MTLNFDLWPWPSRSTLGSSTSMPRPNFVTLGEILFEIWILVKYFWSSYRQKVMHMSPPCIRTGGLNKLMYRYNKTSYTYLLWRCFRQKTFPLGAARQKYRFGTEMARLLHFTLNRPRLFSLTIKILLQSGMGKKYFFGNNNSSCVSFSIIIHVCK